MSPYLTPRFSPISSSVRFSGLSFLRISSFQRTADKSLTPGRSRSAQPGSPLLITLVRFLADGILACGGKLRPGKNRY